MRKQLSDWFASDLGKAALFKEREQLENTLPYLFGCHILQYGYSARTSYLDASPIVDKTVLFLDRDEIERGGPIRGVWTSAEEVPIATGSIDVIVLPHILEYSGDVHKLLHEMDRVLTEDGHIVIIGINPFSLWGVWRFCLYCFGAAPWRGRLVAVPRLRDWLSSLHFDIKKTVFFFFSPPLKNANLLRKCHLMEKLGRWCWPIFGGLYILTAKKRTVPINIIRRWTIPCAKAIKPMTRCEE